VTEGECNITGGKPFSMSQKRRIRKITKIEENGFNICMIHTIIKTFLITESQCHTSNALLPLLKNKV
jgi:hypothetical protein